MKPIKSLIPLSVWLMRIGLVLYAYHAYFKTFTRFNLNQLNFYLASLFLTFSAVLFITGLKKSTTLTVISGFVITIISIYNIVGIIEKGINTTLILNFLIASIALYFLSNTEGK